MNMHTSILEKEVEALLAEHGIISIDTLADISHNAGTYTLPVALLETVESEAFASLTEDKLAAAAVELHDYLSGVYGEGHDADWARLDAAYGRVQSQRAYIDLGWLEPRALH